MSEEISARIAELNDRFRRRFGMPGRGAAGRCPRADRVDAEHRRATVRNSGSGLERRHRVHDFSEDNDPHGEHDFGGFDIHGVGKVFWKIDYYADAKCEWGSEEPSDITRCYRVLTIMRAEEY